MSEWWDRYLFDDLIGLEAAAVTSDGSRHIGPFVRFGDYLTVDDTCVFTRKDKGDGVRLMEEVDHVRLRPKEPFWQGRFLDELEGVRVRVEFGDGGGKRLFLFDSGGGFLDEGLGPCTRLRLGIPVGSAPIPNLPGVWMDKDGNLLAVSGERRVRIWDNHDWMAEELDDDSGELSAHGPYTRYSLQTVEEIPWKPTADGTAPIREGSRTVHLPAVRSFGRLERDKWLAVKNLEESAELVEACKQYLKACDPTDPSGIGDQFDDHANCLACYGVNVDGELGDDWDKAKAGWIGHVRDQRRQAMLGELADVLQTVGNLITAFGITDEEVGRAMSDCLERNRRKGRL